MFVDHLRHGIAQEHNVLIKRLNMTLQLDAIDQVDGYRNMLLAQQIQKGVLQELAFITHDILRVESDLVLDLNTGLEACVPWIHESLSEKGLRPLLSSILSGVPVSLKWSLKRPSRKRLYDSVTWSSEFPWITTIGGFIPPWWA